MGNTGCDYCSNLIYDDDYEGYVCTVNFDEDELARFYGDKHYECPYFQNDDEYKIVRKQM